MMRQYELLERVQAYNPGLNEELLNKAYVYAMQKHGSQMRASGDPYFSHPLEVAAILTRMRLDDATIAVALLHDTIEDTDATRQEIDSIFGSDIGALVDGLTKISRLDLTNRRSKQAENFRKLLLAVAQDIRVLLVKLADRLHNMRTLEHVPANKRQRIAEETLEIYAPLAGRMGIQEFRDEMEEIGFRTLFPEKFKMISEKLHVFRQSQEDLTGEISDQLQEQLAAAGLDAEVTGRQKRPYSIFRKMERKSVAFEQLSDIFGFRVIVDGVAECYQALGIVHTRWPLVPGRFKDYISTPKQNDYRSLHTTVMVKRHRVELQIRTREMHRVAELGIAAHALYSEGGRLVGGRNIQRTSEDSRALLWLRTTIDLLNDGDTPEDFLENTKLELFHDQVFCFTPKGKLIALPRGATAIDFAYAVHTDIGNTLKGAKINGHQLPIITPLQNGDEIEILRSTSQTVVPAWETIARTGKARAAIRKVTRDTRRNQLRELGKIIVARAFKQAGLSTRSEDREALRERLNVPTYDELLVQVGEGRIRAAALQEILGKAAPKAEDDLTATEIVDNVVAIHGVDGDLPIKFAKPGGAVPGDRIVGIVDPGHGVTIYPIQARALQGFEDQSDRWLDVRWDITENNADRFPATVDLEVINRPGVLAEISKNIADTGANIDNLSAAPKTHGFREMRVDLEVTDLKHLMRVIRNLRDLPSVCKVDRYFC